MNDVQSQIAIFLLPILLGIVGYFLVQQNNLLKKLNDKTTEILISIGKGEIRFENIEQRIEWLESELKELKDIIHKTQIR